MQLAHFTTEGELSSGPHHAPAAHECAICSWGSQRACYPLRCASRTAAGHNRSPSQSFFPGAVKIRTPSSTRHGLLHLRFSGRDTFRTHKALTGIWMQSGGGVLLSHPVSSLWPRKRRKGTAPQGGVPSSKRGLQCSSCRRRR